MRVCYDGNRVFKKEGNAFEAGTSFTLVFLFCWIDRTSFWTIADSEREDPWDWSLGRFPLRTVSAFWTHNWTMVHYYWCTYCDTDFYFYEIISKDRRFTEYGADWRVY